MDHTINNASALLEECVVNAHKGKDSLYGWFLGEENLIKNTIHDLNEMLQNNNSFKVDAQGWCGSATCPNNPGHIGTDELCSCKRTT